MSFSEYKAQLEDRYARLVFKFSRTRRKNLWLKLSTMLDNGIPLLQSIDELRKRRLRGSGKGAPEAIALAAWCTKLQEGNPLSISVDGWVSTEERMMISAGENSGQLGRALTATTRLMDTQGAILSAVIGGLAYPFFLSLLAFAVLFFFGNKVIPEITDSVKNVQWMGMASVIVRLGNFVQNWLWLVAVIFAGSVLLFFATLGRFDGRVRIFLDRYPPYNIYRITQGSSWLIAISALINAGMKNNDALEQLAKSGSRWMKTRLNACLFGMRSGLNMGDALAKSELGFPDPEIIDDLGIYASYTGFNEALSRLGNEWMDGSVKKIRGRMKIVFYIMLALVGALVGTIVAGVMDIQLQIGMALQNYYR